jgi:hypothetical protein
MHLQILNLGSNMDTTINLSIYKKNRKSNEIDLGEEGIIYNREGGDEKFIANTTAMAIWDLIDGQRTSQEIAQAIAHACGKGLEDIEHDVYAQLKELRDLDLIEETKG